jgi:hypothetical protein
VTVSALVGPMVAIRVNGIAELMMPITRYCRQRAQHAHDRRNAAARRNENERLRRV